GDRTVREAKAASRKAAENHNPADRASGPSRKAADVDRVSHPEGAVRGANRRTSLMQRHGPANGPAGPTDWHAVNWRRADRIVRNLRQPIFPAATPNYTRPVRPPPTHITPS